MKLIENRGADSLMQVPARCFLGPSHPSALCFISCPVRHKAQPDTAGLVTAERKQVAGKCWKTSHVVCTQMQQSQRGPRPTKTAERQQRKNLFPPAPGLQLLEPTPAAFPPLVINTRTPICRSNYRPQEGREFLPEDVIISGK